MWKFRFWGQAGFQKGDSHRICHDIGVCPLSLQVLGPLLRKYDYLGKSMFVFSWPQTCCDNNQSSALGNYRSVQNHFVSPGAHVGLACRH